ncbi:MAG TPA: HEAT repeat domain-containing protein [Planctomycetota bacterium]|jgi:hypothetical protein|nr:HEAT repeat domain-containing protein [Planctomycetota bacterium]
MDIHFCDLCNESVPQSDLDAGRAYLRRGRVVCAACERAMTHAEGSAPHAEESTTGGVALQAEIASAIGSLTEEPDVQHRMGAILDAPTAAPARSPSLPVAETPPPFASPVVVVPPPPPPRRSAAIIVAVVALVFAAGAVAVLDEEIGGLAKHENELSAQLRAQDGALRDLQKTGGDLREAIAALDARMTQGIGGQREAFEKSLNDLRSENELLRKAGIQLGTKVDELRDANAAKSQEIDKHTDEISHRIAKSEDDARALADRLAQMEEQATRAPVPPASAATAPTASRWASLVSDLQSPKAATRWEAVDQMGQAGDPEALPYLLPMLKDTDVFVRMATARVIGDLKAPTAVPALIDALEDVEPAVREAALGSLRTLTGKDKELRFDPMGSETDRAKKVKALRDWWKKIEEEGGLTKTPGQG